MLPDYIFFLLLFALTIWITTYAQHKKRQKAWQYQLTDRQKRRKKQLIKRLTGEE